MYGTDVNVTSSNFGYGVAQANRGGYAGASAHGYAQGQAATSQNTLAQTPQMSQAPRTLYEGGAGLVSLTDAKKAAERMVKRPQNQQ